MPLTKQLTKEDCDKWAENKLKKPDRPKNPLTNYRVLPGSKTYIDLDKQCDTHTPPKRPSPKKSRPLFARDLTKEDCEKFKKNPKKNPITNYKIASNSLIYKLIEKKCKELLPSPINKQHISPAKTKTKPILNRKLTLADCLYWKDNPKKNPISKYTLADNSKILKDIAAQCNPLLDEYYKNNDNKSIKSSQSPKSSSSAQSTQKDILKDSKQSINHIDYILHYPDLDDKYFRDKLMGLTEFYIHKIPSYSQIQSKDDFNNTSANLCTGFEKTLYQYFISNYISTRTPYKSCLLYHGVGVGKTCSAITLAEGFLTSHSMYEEPKIWVIMPLALKGSFKEQIFSLFNLDDYQKLAEQCTGDLYIKLTHLMKETAKERVQTKIKKLIKSRYRIFTYEAFANFIENEYISKSKIVKDKVIIVDEAHNIRSMSTATDNTEKRVYTALTQILEDGINNRLVLLSATPMYNKPEDIFDILYLLCLNDKREELLEPLPTFFNDKNMLNAKAVEIIKQLASNYISYLKGKNPFTFAIKLSPNYVPNIKLLTQEYKKDSNNKIINSIYNGWLSQLDDDIVISYLGEKQISYLSSDKGDDNNVFNNLQPMNIVYDTALGEKGFNTFFTRTDNTNILNVKYNKSYLNALYPDNEHLGKYSAKLLNICNILKNTKGIVVIYSGYIWSGIIPMAVALEHMGFIREGGANILNNADTIPNPPKYGNKFSPKYCILSSENSEVMGNTSIDNLMKTINNARNVDGSMVKVILITPVAGEGLSFYNVREMHLLEPWFHFNRVTQIVGRGIRNCRHQDLPLQERNVTVFMHASSYENSDRETPDIHAFRIAANKLVQSNIIEKIIRDNAVDCILMKNINYFPKSIFELGKMKLLTSQNVDIDYEFGDKEDDEPKCFEDLSKPKINAALRAEVYEPFVPLIQNKLRKLFLDKIHNEIYYVTFEELFEMFNFHRDIIYKTIEASVYPNFLIDGYILITHENGIHAVKIIQDNPLKLRISYKEDIPAQNMLPTKCKKIQGLINKNIEEATIALYLSLNSVCFTELAKKFIENADLSAADATIANYLYTQGALISKTELKSLRLENKYIGYVNIFNTEFEPIIYINGRYRDLIDREKEELISKRKYITKPVNMTTEKMAWGILSPLLIKKTNTFENTFKLLTAGSSVGVKTGIVCTSLQKQAQDNILKELGVNKIYDTKAENCQQIAIQLFKLNRLTIYPEYKPNL
jgi:hypothetical protein